MTKTFSAHVAYTLLLLSAVAHAAPASALPLTQTTTTLSYNLIQPVALMTEIPTFTWAPPLEAPTTTSTSDEGQEPRVHHPILPQFEGRSVALAAREAAETGEELRYGPFRHSSAVALGMVTHVPVAVRSAVAAEDSVVEGSGVQERDIAAMKYHLKPYCWIPGVIPFAFWFGGCKDIDG